jgi:lipoprotein-anchoring transpeptidase ErfK/SrfK
MRTPRLIAVLALACAGLLAACATTDEAAKPTRQTETTPQVVPPTTSPKPAKPGPTKLRALPEMVEAHAVIVKKAPPKPPAGVPCDAGAAACVDISGQHAWLLSAGKVLLGPVPITTGRPGHVTPTGTFHVLYKDINHLSKEFDYAPMPFSVFFVSGIAFHEGSLSVPSHGCVHLSTSSAQSFYNGLSAGDVVQVVP